ncbi:MAG: dockerin type I repeat-containing protein [Planctomycetes bacterium]|nr:dockerin type I repeat-containing protein [Planctomycetota bacterium]
MNTRIRAGLASMFASSLALLLGFLSTEASGQCSPIDVCGERIEKVLAAGATDSYCFSASEGDTVVALMGTATEDLDPHLELSDANGVLYPVRWGIDSATLRVTLEPDATGVCTLICRDHFGVNSGTYGVSLVRISPSGTSCASLVNGQPVIGTMKPGQLAAYCFCAEAGASLTVLMGAISGEIDPHLEVYDPDGVLLDTKWGIDSAEIRLGNEQVAKSGTYIVICRDHDGYREGEYGVTATNSCSECTEIGVCGEYRPGNLASAGAMDVFCFSAGGGDTVVALMGRATGDLDPRLELNDANGVLYPVQWGVDSATLRVTLEPGATGVCALICRDHFGVKAGAYGVSLVRISPGGSPCRRLATGEPVAGALRPGQLDAYALCARAGTSLTLHMGAIAGDIYPHIEVYDPTGVLLDTRWWADSAEIRLESEQVTTSGTYTVICRDHDGYREGEYRVTAAFTGCHWGRGDVNCDLALDLGDPIYLLNYLFASGPPPCCEKFADGNDDGTVDIGDAVIILNYLFAEAPDLADPFNNCNDDPTPDDLTCDSYPPCPFPK